MSFMITAAVITVAATGYSMVASNQAAKKAAHQMNEQMDAAQALTGTANPETTVDPTANNQNQINQLGRAALISTSPQGVQGTDNVGRYRLLGN